MLRPNQKLPKSEILRSKKIIQELFSKDSSSFYLYPFKIVYIPSQQPSETYPQILVSVSKRHFKRAIIRNTIRRRIKEAYRLNKSKLFPAGGNFCVDALAIIFVAKEKLEFSYIQEKLIKTFSILQNK